ncbi:MAG: mechanosensitive ion channel domain-containing protein [Pseudomonadota bacterium]
MQNPTEDITQNVDTLATMATESIETLMPLAFNAIGALAVFIVGIWIAGRIRNGAKAYFKKTSHFDETLESFLSSLIYYAAVALVVITTLGVFGVPTTSFAAILGAAGLAIGLALQGTLGHIASGVMLLAFRPFGVGNYVKAGGHEGTVKEVNLFTTVLATVDNKKVIIPNGEVWSGSVINYSAYPKRRVDLTFGVSYNDDLQKAMTTIKSVVDADTRIDQDPAPTIAVDNLGDSSVDIICRVWVDSGNYFPVKWDLTQKVKERLDSDGITIPFPTQTLIYEKTS